PRPLRPAQSCRVGDLDGFPGLKWQTKQEVGPGIVYLRSRAQLRGSVAIEPKRAARRLETAALRLEVIQLRVIVFGTEPEIVLPARPAQVCTPNILVIAEQEWVTSVGVSHV